MTPDEMQKRRKAFIGHAKNALKKLPGARFYALSDAQLLAIAAVLDTWAAERDRAGEHGFSDKDVIDFLDSFRSHVPSLFQQRPPDESKLPELIKDPVTGAIPANPWSPGSINVDEQMLLMREHPELGNYLKATAKGLTYSSLLNQKKEKAQREQLREITYDEDSHRTNPYVNNADLTRLSAEIRSLELKPKAPATL